MCFEDLGTIDTKEQIEMCLNCKKERCVNCLYNGMPKNGKPGRKRKTYEINGKWMTMQEIADELGIHKEALKSMYFRKKNNMQEAVEFYRRREKGEE